MICSLYFGKNCHPFSKTPQGLADSVFTLTVRLPQFEPFLVTQAASSPAQGGGRKVFVIDEIGKMELFSQPFIRAVRQILDSPRCSILGTIPISRGKPLALVEEVRSRRDVKVFTVSGIHSRAHTRLYKQRMRI